MTTPADTSNAPGARASEPPPGRAINGRYLVVRQLGSGGMGNVFLVQDREEKGRSLALKCLPATQLNPKAIAAFQREYLVLAALHHPGLARVYDFGTDDQTGEPYFTSELVDGVQLLRACEGIDFSAAPGLDFLLEVLAQILRALEFIHAHGLIHGDVKPENILVIQSADTGGAEADTGPRVKLIDFGLSTREKQFSGKRLIGTPSYIAPETITGSHLDRRADLYSLGAVLYRLVTGQGPFVGGSNLAVLRGHVESAPEPPHLLAPGLPEVLGEIILRLLRKRAAERYQNALEVLEEINHALGRSFPLETLETGRSYIHCARSACRRQELRALCQSFTAAAGIQAREKLLEGRHSALLGEEDGVDAGDVQESFSLPAAAIVLLRGEHGAGKRTLVAQFRSLAETRGAYFLEVDCAAGKNLPGQHDFQQLLLGMCAWGRRRDDPPAFQAAARLATEFEAGNPAAVEDVAFVALAEHLLEASRRQPLVLHLHRLSEAGYLLSGFVAALLDLLRPGAPAGSRFLLTATVPNGPEREANPLLRLFEPEVSPPATLELFLARLDREGVEGLLDAMFPNNDLGPLFISQVLEASDGNLQAVAEICEFCLERGHIARTTAGWVLTGDYDAAAVPVRLRRELEEKIRGLSRSALNLGIALAILDGAAELDLAVQLAGMSREAAEDGLDVLLRDGIVEKRRSRHAAGPEDSGPVYAFVHPSARDILYRLVPPGERSNLHNLAGVLCERFYSAGGGGDAAMIAPQFLRAGNVREGLRYGLEAARRHAQESRLRQALETYEQVLALSGREGDSDRVRYEMAMVHFQMGEFEEAGRLLAKLATSGTRNDDGPEHSRVCIDLSRSYSRLGLFFLAEGWLKRAMAAAAGPGGEQRPGAGLLSHAHVLLAQAELALLKSDYRECMRACQEALARQGHLPDAKLRSQCHQLLAESHFALDDVEAAMRHCREALRFSSPRDAPELKDISLFLLGKLYKYSGRFAPALRVLHVCCHLRRKMEAVDARAEVLVEMGGLQLFLERPRQALHLLEQGCRLYRKTKNAVGMVRSLNLLAEAHRLLGRHEEAERVLEDARERQKKIGAVGNCEWESLMVLSKAALDTGNLERAATYLAEARSKTPQDTRSALKLLERRSQLELQGARFAAALETARRGLEKAQGAENSLRSNFFLESQVWLYLRLGQTELARAALTSLAEVVWHYRLPVHLGRAEVLEAVTSMREGRSGEAAGCFQRADGIFREEQSERDLAQLHFQEAAFLLERGDHEATFLLLEEALYLAKKLNLHFLRTQLYLKLGLFESRIPEVDPRRVGGYLRRAEKLASEAPYPDLLWQTHYHLGCFLRDSGALQESESLLLSARSGRERILRGLPAELVEGYLRASPGSDLERLGEEVETSAPGGARFDVGQF